MHQRTPILLTLAISVLGVCLPSTAEVPNLEGTWAMLQVYPQLAVLPIAGEVARSSYILQIVDIRQEGYQLTMVDRYCRTVVNDGTPLVETTIPDQFMDALLPAVRTATLLETSDGMQFQQPPYLEVRGALLEAPATDPLPTDSLDPRVFDQDGDENPGMTVSVKVLGVIEGETYIVQRVQYSLSGYVVSPDRIEGFIEWSDEQVVLAATNPLLEVETTGVHDPDPSKHRFVMLRVDQTWTCVHLRDQWATLFGMDVLDLE